MSEDKRFETEVKDQIKHLKELGKDDKYIDAHLLGWCLGYCHLANQLSEEFGSYIDINPALEYIQHLNQKKDGNRQNNNISPCSSCVSYSLGRNVESN